jgi:hypothetical protein
MIMDINKKINLLFGAVAIISMLLLVFLASYLALFAPVLKISL